VVRHHDSCACASMATYLERDDSFLSRAERKKKRKRKEKRKKRERKEKERKKKKRGNTSALHSSRISTCFRRLRLSSSSFFVFLSPLVFFFDFFVLDFSFSFFSLTFWLVACGLVLLVVRVHWRIRGLGSGRGRVGRWLRCRAGRLGLCDLGGCLAGKAQMSWHESRGEHKPAGAESVDSMDNRGPGEPDNNRSHVSLREKIPKLKYAEQMK
jgi:hypothetical protein